MLNDGTCYSSVVRCVRASPHHHKSRSLSQYHPAGGANRPEQLATRRIPSGHHRCYQSILGYITSHVPCVLTSQRSVLRARAIRYCRQHLCVVRQHMRGAAGQQWAALQFSPGRARQHALSQQPPPVLTDGGLMPLTRIRQRRRHTASPSAPNPDVRTGAPWGTRPSHHVGPSSPQHVKQGTASPNGLFNVRIRARGELAATGLLLVCARIAGRVTALLAREAVRSQLTCLV